VVFYRIYLVIRSIFYFSLLSGELKDCHIIQIYVVTAVKWLSVLCSVISRNELADNFE